MSLPGFIPPPPGQDVYTDPARSGSEFFTIQNPNPGGAGSRRLPLRHPARGVQLAGQSDPGKRLFWGEPIPPATTFDADDGASDKDYTSLLWTNRLTWSLAANQLWVAWDGTQAFDFALLWVFYSDVVRHVRTDIPLDGSSAQNSIVTPNDDLSVQTGDTMVRALSAAGPIVASVPAGAEVTVHDDSAAVGSARWRPRRVREVGIYAEADDTYQLRIYPSLGDGIASTALLAANRYSSVTAGGKEVVDLRAGVPWDRVGARLAVYGSSATDPLDVSLYAELRG